MEPAFMVSSYRLFEIALVFERFDHVASRIVNASLPRLWTRIQCADALRTICRSMKARLQRERLETARLVERARRLMCESRKLLEQRQAQLRQQEQFLEQHATIAHEMLGDRAICATPL